MQQPSVAWKTKCLPATATVTASGAAEAPPPSATGLNREGEVAIEGRAEVRRPIRGTDGEGAKGSKTAGAIMEKDKHKSVRPKLRKR